MDTGKGYMEQVPVEKVVDKKTGQVRKRVFYEGQRLTVEGSHFIVTKVTRNRLFLELQVNGTLGAPHTKRE